MRTFFQSSLCIVQQYQHLWAPALVENIPAVEMMVRLNKVTCIVKSITKEEDDFQFERILIADSGFLKIFEFKLIQRNPATVSTNNQINNLRVE